VSGNGYSTNQMITGAVKSVTSVEAVNQHVTPSVDSIGIEDVANEEIGVATTPASRWRPAKVATKPATLSQLQKDGVHLPPNKGLTKSECTPPASQCKYGSMPAPGMSKSFTPCIGGRDLPQGEMMEVIREITQTVFPETYNQTDPSECDWLLWTLQELYGFLRTGDSSALSEGIHILLSPVSGNGHSTNLMPVHLEGWDNIDSGVEHDCLFAALIQGLLLSQGAHPFPYDLRDQARNLRLRMIQHQEYSASTNISENLFIGHFETQPHLIEESSEDNAQRHPDITSPPPAGLPEIQTLADMLNIHICVYRLTPLGTVAKYTDANRGKQVLIQILNHEAHFTLLRPLERQVMQQVFTLEDHLEMILSSIPWQTFRIAATINRNWAATARHMLETRETRLNKMFQAIRGFLTWKSHFTDNKVAKVYGLNDKVEDNQGEPPSKHTEMGTIFSTIQLLASATIAYIEDDGGPIGCRRDFGPYWMYFNCPHRDHTFQRTKRSHLFAFLEEMEAVNDHDEWFVDRGTMMTFKDPYDEEGVDNQMQHIRSQMARINVTPQMQEERLTQTFERDRGLGGHIYRTFTVLPSPPFNRKRLNRLREFQTGIGICYMHLSAEYSNGLRTPMEAYPSKAGQILNRCSGPSLSTR
jgi:hypothetical protein